MEHEIIEVLRISTNRGQFEVFRRPSATYETINVHASAGADTTRRLERNLGHVPELLKCNLRPIPEILDDHFNLEYRCLIHMDWHVDTASGSWNDDYFIYKCIEPTPMRLPKNEFFEHTNTYGDAFVFKLNRHRPFDRDEMANFGSMRGFARSLDNGTHAVGMLKEMLDW